MFAFLLFFRARSLKHKSFTFDAKSLFLLARVRSFARSLACLLVPPASLDVVVQL